MMTERKEKGLTEVEEVEYLKGNRIKDSRAFKFRSKWLRKRARRNRGSWEDQKSLRLLMEVHSGTVSWRPLGLEN